MTQIAGQEAKTTLRLRSLDGLRGVCALVVLFHHSLLTIPTLAAPYFGEDQLDITSPSWWFVHTPLHLIWDGTASVYVFFILSGIVLTLPVVRSREKFDWKAFYPQRAARLYFPVWAAVAVAALVYAMLPRTNTPTSLWLAHRTTSLRPKDVAESITLIFGTGNIVSPLWSLQWEVIFSALLPLYVSLARRMRGGPALGVVFCLIIVALGAISSSPIFTFLPMFMIGVLIAIALDRVRFEPVVRRSAYWRTVMACALILCCARWLLAALGAGPTVLAASTALTLVGAMMVVVTAIHWTGARRNLERKLPQWLGKISFSLYLVHEPIVVGLGFVFHGQWWWSIPFGITASFGAAMLFYFLGERPSHRLANYLKAKFQNRGQRATAC